MPSLISSSASPRAVLKPDVQKLDICPRSLGCAVELNRKAKGGLAELKVATDLRARGREVAFLLGEDWDFDLILCRAGDELERVQVQVRVRCDGRVILVPACAHSLTNGNIKTTKLYTSATVDRLAVWEATLDRCYYIPATELGGGWAQLSLRFRPAANCQVRGVRLAEQYANIWLGLTMAGTGP